MSRWIKGFWRGLVEELLMKSSYGEKLVIDTFFRWLLGVSIFLGFYFWIYNFDARGVETDKWLHEVFGWKLSDEPSVAKVAWHRLAAGMLSGATIAAMTLGYVVHLYRRVKARIDTSKASLVKAEKTGKSEDTTRL